MATVTFDYQTWAFRYPELAAFTFPGMAAALFAEASLYVSPLDGSVVTDEDQRLLILNMLVAHLAALAGARAGTVGRTASATEGSVSVSFAPMALPGSAEWYGQTSYGLTAWQALAPYRTMRYVPGPAGQPRNWFSSPLIRRFY